MTAAGRYVRLDQVALDWPPLRTPPVLAGAEGPRTLQLAGGHADGTILTGGTTPAQITRACALIEDGRAQTGRREQHRVTCYLLAATGSDAQSRVDAEASRWGWPSSADRAVAGSVDAVAAAVGRWAAAGADSVILQPTGDEPDPEGFVAFAAAVGRMVERPG